MSRADVIELIGFGVLLAGLWLLSVPIGAPVTYAAGGIALALFGIVLVASANRHGNT